MTTPHEAPAEQDAAQAPAAPLNPAASRRDAYAPVAKAIDFLVTEWTRQPGLEETATHVGLSPAHFQRVFRDGAGVSPKRFLQYLSAGAARRSLREGGDLFDAADAAGLSGPSRLHDLMLSADAMTPGAFRRKGAGLTIRWAVAPGPFGAALIGATDRGVCWLSFEDEGGHARGLREMQEDWPAAVFEEDPAFIAPLAERAFAFAVGDRLSAPLRLHVQGTNFQIRVWEALLRIPDGETRTYGEIADIVCTRKASRAVGAAVGANPVSVLIPCHRVIRASGAIHAYRWGPARKQALLALEAARTREAGATV